MDVCAQESLRDVLKDSIDRAILSHAIWKAQTDKRKFAEFSMTRIEKILTEKRLPSLAEQQNNTIEWIGDQLRDPAGCVSPQPSLCHLPAKVGASDETAVRELLSEMMSMPEPKILRNCLIRGDSLQAGLLLGGWERYEEIKHGRIDSRKAFMAMKFDSDVERDVFPCFGKAVEAAGFELISARTKPEPGLIDVQMRGMIRRAKFVVADLTDDNQGAYWESGFAEGLDKKVIYTCEKSVFDNKGTHFDTNHLFTILWEIGNLTKAAKDVTEAVRSAFPADATWED